FMQAFNGRGVMADDSRPTPVTDAIGKFRLRDGLEINVVASEPAISQPLHLSWDSQGRMWVVQYRQYQFPAGLKVVRYDQHLRAVFDRVPEPPPDGVRGSDVISVLSDSDGDGVYDSQRDVIEGLNIASSVQVGRGGIWVLNPPYLLFYPDTDRDAIPDGDPEVHLSGFGLQDTHSVANNLTWGPDGWLYGCNGSTTTGDVSSAVTKGVRFEGQCVWRYEPSSKRFEIYAEGGGNNFSLEIDAKGRVFSGNNGGNTRGWYFPQGSYSHKNWGKHGPLTNSHAYGFFRSMPLQGDSRRFAQAFCIYESNLFPNEYRERIIAPNSLHNLVWCSRRVPDGSTFQTVDEDNLVDSEDHWFRPVYAGVGPDGAVYLADWYDSRLSHVSPLDDWHKTSGRVYRLQPEGSLPRFELGDLASKSSAELVTFLGHPRRWVRRRASLELGWRSDVAIAEELARPLRAARDLRPDSRNQMLGLGERVCTLSMLGCLSPGLAAECLDHPNADVRRWAVRLMGDRHQTIPGFAARAAAEHSLEVRCQMASSAKRLRSNDAIPVIAALLRHDADATDPHLPLLVWWAVESHCNDWPAIQHLVKTKGFWQRSITRQTLAGRLMKRFASGDDELGLRRCEWVLQSTQDEHVRRILLAGLHEAFQGRTLPPLPIGLQNAYAEYLEGLGGAPIVIALRTGAADAVPDALESLASHRTAEATRMLLVDHFAEQPDTAALKPLLALATGRSSASPPLQRLAITALAAYQDDGIADSLVAAMGSRIGREHDLRATAMRTLAGRVEWSHRLLDECLQWRLKPRDFPADVVQQLRASEEVALSQKVQRVFGATLAATAPERVHEMKRVQKIVGTDLQRGDHDAGAIQFRKRCATCHKLFGEGGQLGPPLDGYERGNALFWINSLAAPSMEIREGYQTFLVLTVDGRSFSGRIESQTDQQVHVRMADDRLVIVQRDEVETMRALNTSLMPDNLLLDATDQEIRDLFAYLSLGA
ncbi:MAG: dehydrogenase, partial [Planctomycetota bacterium]